MTPVEKAIKRVLDAEERFEKAKQYHLKVKSWGEVGEVKKAIERARKARDGIVHAKKVLAAEERKQAMLEHVGEVDQEI